MYRRTTWILVLSILYFMGYGQSYWQSDLVKQDVFGKLHYYPDEDGFVLPDFSYAGYKNGESVLPYTSIKFNRSPIYGDNTEHIQSAIDSLALMRMDTNGFRGTVLLAAGYYEIHGQLKIEHSGIVLRGAGNEANPELNTILQGVGNTPSNRILVQIGARLRYSESLYNINQVQPTNYTSILDAVVPVGSKSFRVYNASSFAVGDRILLQHDCSESWLEAINQGSTETDTPWQTGDYPIIYDRTITNIEGNQITVHAPVFYTLNQSLSKTHVFHYPVDLPTINNVGIEYIRLDNDYSDPEDEQHVRSSVSFCHVENAWARECTAIHFSYAGFVITYSRHVTIDHCNALDPISKLDGGKRYNYSLEYGAQLVLVKYSYARNGRHHYIANGTSVCSGNVFYNCVSDGAYGPSEGHRHWVTGLLYDNLLEINVRRAGTALLGLHNRGDFGTGHGWSSAHSVAWNCNFGTGKAIIQKPPTAQNYSFGCMGEVTGNGYFQQAMGHVEGNNQSGLFPQSLYLTQLQNRL